MASFRFNRVVSLYPNGPPFIISSLAPQSFSLHKALFISVSVVIIIYVAVAVTVLGNLPVSQIVSAKDYALAEAAQPFLGTIGFKIIAIAALLSTSSGINATLYGGANISYVLAKEG